MAGVALVIARLVKAVTASPTERPTLEFTGAMAAWMPQRC